MAIEMKQIVKRFGRVIANNRIDWGLETGEVHALLGENGAGKSTLMKILAGIVRPDSGSIQIGGNEAKINSASDALSLGVGMVQQHFSLVDSMRVYENFLIGDRRRWVIIDKDKLCEEITALSVSTGLKVNPRSFVGQLSVGEKQRVEILRLLYRQAKILIFDEPTAVLTPQETAELGLRLRQLANLGHSVVLITHKLREVTEFCDRVTVLKDGKKVATLAVSGTSETQLSNLMFERELALTNYNRRQPSNRVVMQIMSLTVAGNNSLPAMSDFSLSIHEGEIVGVAGIAGSGQRELVEAVFGHRRSIKGRVILFDRDLTNKPPASFVDLAAYIPADRIGVGTAQTMSVADNFALKHYRQPPYSWGPFISAKNIQQFASEQVVSFNIKLSGVGALASSLSGGNVQKLVLARELAFDPKVIVAELPTRGLDLETTQMIHKQLLLHSERGCGIFLVSEDLEELMKLCHRIVVVSSNRMAGIVDAQAATREEIGLMMSGGGPKRKGTSDESNGG